MNFEQYQPLAYKIANRFRSLARSRGIEYDDLLQTANLGLLEAIERYDETQKVKPLTYFYRYVYWRVHGEIFSNRERRRFKAGDPVVVYTDNPLQASVEGPERSIEQAEEINLVLGGFSDKDQRIIREYGEGYKPTEIAERVGCSRQNVHRVVNNFKDQWTKAHG